MAVSHIKSSTIGDMTGTVTVFATNGSTTTAAATDLVRPSDWNSNHAQLYTLSGNTTNASTASGTNVVFQAGGDVTLGGSTGTIVFNAGIGPNNEQWIGTGVRPFANVSTSSLGQNSLYITPAIFDRQMSAVALKLPVLVTNSSSAVSSGQKGLIDNAGFSAVAAADTAASHAGWAESTAYSNGTRPAATWSAAASGQIAPSAASAFNINAAATIKGAGVISNNTKGGTTGTLYSAGAFAANRGVDTGDTLNVSLTLAL